MGAVSNIVFVGFIVSLICMLATYDPLDTTYFWMNWAVIVMMFGVGYMVDKMFGETMFVYDPDPTNWRRKVGDGR